MASISLLERANKIQKKDLERNSDMYKVIDSVYAMARTIEERLGMKNQELQQRGRQKNQKDQVKTKRTKRGGSMNGK